VSHAHTRPSRSTKQIDFDARMMQRALALARRGEGRVEPNPMVGCVIVARGRTIGEGYHRRFGGPHAEVEALRACQADPRGATVYVTLEPCCHCGKTPPCTEALLAAGVARVVTSMRDPNPLVAGRGVHRLRRAGVRVEIGIEAEPARALLAPYLTRTCLHRPYVIAKWAQTLDGKLATRTGDSQWISGVLSRRLVHRLRGRVDALLVGAGTVRADDPLLTAREVPRRRIATRVVLDTRLRLSPDSRVATTAGTVPTWVFTGMRQVNSAPARALTERGVVVMPARTRGGRLDLRDVLRRLAAQGVTNLLVEGGPTVLTALFAAGVVDEACVFVAPLLLGGVGAPSVPGGRGPARLAEAAAPARVCTRRCGSDIMWHLWWDHLADGAR